MPLAPKRQRPGGLAQGESRQPFRARVEDIAGCFPEIADCAATREQLTFSIRSNAVSPSKAAAESWARPEIPSVEVTRLCRSVPPNQLAQRTRCMDECPFRRKQSGSLAAVRSSSTAHALVARRTNSVQHIRAYESSTPPADQITHPRPLTSLLWAHAVGEATSVAHVQSFLSTGARK